MRAAARAAAARPGDPQDIDRQEREFNARAVLEELTAVADWFGSVRGRKKSILFFSEGISYDIHDVFANGGNNAAAMIQVAHAGSRARGDEGQRQHLRHRSARAAWRCRTASIELHERRRCAGAGLDERGLQNESRLARDSLQAFADETGGFAVVNTNGFANAFDRIVQENSSYYVLAYYPPNPKRDGKFHNINVRVTRPGLTVRVRRGYANPTGKPPVPAKSELSAGTARRAAEPDSDRAASA